MDADRSKLELVSLVGRRWSCSPLEQALVAGLLRESPLAVDVDADLFGEVRVHRQLPVTRPMAPRSAAVRT
ncbi:MAG TPA: hypothetical protein VFI46_11620, partial [Jiangellaceae bacterium]|nr:hypothetical protein [Jiangellaceae bacterium]